jgi:hypothetical protein
MKKLLLLIAMCVLLSKAFGMGSWFPKKPVTPEAPVEISKPIETPVAVEPAVVVGKISVLLETKGFSEDQQIRLEKIRASVEKIINSDKFKEHVNGYYTKGKQTFNETDIPNSKVFEILTEKNWNVKIEYKSGSRGVLGWTNPSTPWVWFNSKYFDGREDDGLVGTFCHEMAHKFGFSHAFRSYSGREFTVPYGVGTICSQLHSHVL